MMLIRDLTRSFLVFCAAAGLARASDISIVLPNNNAEQLGYTTRYQVINTNQLFPSPSVTWTYSQTDSVSPPNPVGMGSGPSSSLTYIIPGTFKIQAYITYSGNQANPTPPPPETVTRTVTIPPPSITAIQGAGNNGAGGPNTPYATALPGPNDQPATATSLGGQPGCWIYFILKSGGNTIGGMIDDFTVQENLTNFNIYGADQPDSGWRPATPTTRAC
jgi:hypothetical protein